MPTAIDCKNCGKRLDTINHKFRYNTSGFPYHYPFCPDKPTTPPRIVTHNLKTGQQLQALVEELRGGADYDGFSDAELKDLVGEQNLAFVKDLIDKSETQKEFLDALKQEIAECKEIEGDVKKKKPKLPEPWSEKYECEWPPSESERKRKAEENAAKMEEFRHLLEERYKEIEAEKRKQQGVTLSLDEVKVLTGILVKAGVIEIDGSIADWIDLKEQAVLQKLTR